MNIANQLIILNRIRRLSYLMDSSFRIPFVGWKVGLDPILGIIPGVGDLLSTAVSLYIVSLAIRFKLPITKVIQMLLNVGIETLLGIVPVLGDIFDAYYKSNIRNLEILEKHLNEVSTNLENADFKLPNASELTSPTT
jgi:Domain of unknown function (DUF4112)